MSTQYVVTDEELTAVANAIRTKGGTNADLEWYSGFVSAIGNISTGNSISVDISVTGGYNGGAVISISFNGTEVFTATGSNTYNTAYNKTADTIETDYGDVDILVTPPATNTSNLVITITGENTITKSIKYTGNNTSYGYSFVDVGVLVFSASQSGSSGVRVGTENPSASLGGNGEVYLKCVNYPKSKLPKNYYNISNWTKNGAAFTVFDNTFEGLENTLIQKGGNGYERIYISMEVEENTDYVFGLDYYAPSTVPSGYSGQLNIKASFANSSTMASSNALSSYEATTNLSRDSASTYSSYSLTFNSGSHTSVYLVIDLNITDNSQCTLKFKNLIFCKSSESQSLEELTIITKPYLKVDGAWQSLIGSEAGDVNHE